MFAFACAQGSRVARATTIELQNSNNDNENIICVYIIKLLSWTHTGVDKAMPATLGISREKTHTRTHTHVPTFPGLYTSRVCVCVCACAMQCVQSLIVQRAAAAAAAIKYYNDNNYNCLFIIIYFFGTSDMRFWIRQLSYHSTIYGFLEITYTRQTVSV
jgi:hypothetical protein